MLSGPEILDAERCFAIQTWIPRGEVFAEFIEQLCRSGICEGVGLAAFVPALGDAPGFVAVEAREVVVEFDPVVEGYVAEAHGDEVFGAVAEGAVGEGFRGFEVPGGVGRGQGCFEAAGFPLPGFAHGEFGGGGRCCAGGEFAWCGFFELRGGGFGGGRGGAAAEVGGDGDEEEEGEEGDVEKFFGVGFGEEGGDHGAAVVLGGGGLGVCTVEVGFAGVHGGGERAFEV